MINKLKELVGKSFLYKGIEITINDVKLVSTTYVVKTNKRAYNFFENEVETFISELKDIQIKKNKIMEIETKKIIELQQTDLSIILLDTIERIQNDKDYVKQANAICNVVTQMINVKKLEIQLKK
jgi:hypothetical protein